MPNKNKNSGFTLVEISIVLVIIGLIVGGVLVGMDLVSAARVRAQINQIQEYNTAVNTFKIKYGYLPGDIPDAQAQGFGFTLGASIYGGSSGNESGLLDIMAYGVNNELSLFWVHLGQSGLINNTFTPSNYNTSGLF